jgi:hypothetical protein
MAQKRIIQFKANVDFVTVPAVWTVDPDGQLTMREVTATRSRLDAWKTREAFLGLKFSKKKPEALLVFLNSVGVFARMTGSPHPVNISAAEEWQRLIGELLCTPFQLWRQTALRYPQGKEEELFQSDQFRMNFRVGVDLPVAKLITKTALQAILATIHIDHARAAKYRICEAQGCGKGYEITSAHKRRYCDQDCAHLESVRRLRLKRRLAAEFAVHKSRKGMDKAKNA